MFRSYAGLDPVTFVDAAHEINAQECALMCNANNVIKHTGWATSDTCYTAAGAAGCGSSNLEAGVAPPNAAVAFWLWDGNGQGNTLGHRRWILSPPLGNISLGLVGSFGAMYVFGTQAYVTSLGWYSWPPQGTTPVAAMYQLPMIFHYANVNFTSAPTIVSCAVCDGNGVSVLSGSCYTDDPGFGAWGSIFMPTSAAGAGCYTVSLSYKVNNGPVESIAYVSELYDCSVAGGGSNCFGNGTVVCNAPSPASALVSWVDLFRWW